MFTRDHHRVRIDARLSALALRAGSDLAAFAHGDAAAPATIDDDRGFSGRTNRRQRFTHRMRLIAIGIDDALSGATNGRGLSDSNGFAGEREAFHRRTIGGGFSLRQTFAATAIVQKHAFGVRRAFRGR